MFNNRLIKGSFILLIAFGLFNFFNFAYQFAMARFLTVAEYGILATLFAMIYIFAVFSESIQTVIAKYVVGSRAGQIRNLLRRSMRKSRFLATVVFLIYLLASILFAFIFDIPYMLLALNGFIVYLMFLLPITRGALQGRQQFMALGTNLVLESVLKLIISVGMVLLGWKVYGAIGGFLLGAIFAFALSFLSLRDIYKTKEEHSKTENIYAYAKPTTFITAIIVFFYSIDVILAKILFTPETAGAYAIASILGKIIFWISIPVGKAMFPISAESKENNKKSPIFATALVILLILIGVILTVFYFFSDLIVTFFSGKSVPEAASILFYLGSAFSIISIANIILLYRLSRGSIKGYFVLILCNVIEVLILLFASSNLKTFSLSFIAASFIMLVITIVFVRLNRHI